MTMSFRKMEALNFTETSSRDESIFQKTKFFINPNVRIWNLTLTLIFRGGVPSSYACVRCVTKVSPISYFLNRLNLLLKSVYDAPSCVKYSFLLFHSQIQSTYHQEVKRSGLETLPRKAKINNNWKSIQPLFCSHLFHASFL